MTDVDADQKAHFDQARHQYARDAILHPPRHTRLELEGVLQALSDLPAGAPVLDFGAGTGRLTIALAQVGHAVTAVDISDASLETLRGVAAEVGLDAVQTSTTLPTGRTFAAVVGADVLHHVDLDAVLPQLAAVLPPGGKMVFTEPGGMHPAWYAYLTIRHDIRVERRIVTCNCWTLPRAFARHGFRDVQVTGVGLLPRPLLGWSEAACRRNDRAGNLPVLRWVAYRYLIEATKEG